MLTFKSFLSEAKMSLKHIGGDHRGNNGFSYEELTNFLSKGTVKFNPTEKLMAPPAKLDITQNMDFSSDILDLV